MVSVKYYALVNTSRIIIERTAGINLRSPCGESSIRDCWRILVGQSLRHHRDLTDFSRNVHPYRNRGCHDDVEVVTVLIPLGATSLLSDSSKPPINETAADMDFVMMWGQDVARSFKCNILTPGIIKDDDPRLIIEENIVSRPKGWGRFEPDEIREMDPSTPSRQAIHWHRCQKA